MLTVFSKSFFMIARTQNINHSLDLKVCWLRLIHITKGIFFIITDNSSGSNILLFPSSCGSGQSIVRR